MSGTYTISYNGKDISGNVTLKEPPTELTGVELVTNENVAYDSANAVYNVKNLIDTVTVRVTVSNPKAGSAIQIGDKTTEIDPEHTVYDVDYSIASLAFDTESSVTVTLIGTGTGSDSVKIKRLAPEISSLVLKDAENDNGIYYLQKAGDVTPVTVTATVSESLTEDFALSFVNGDDESVLGTPEQKDNTYTLTFDAYGSLTIKAQIKNNDEEISSNTVSLVIAEPQISITAVSDSKLVGSVYYSKNNSVKLHVTCYSLPGYSLYRNATKVCGLSTGLNSIDVDYSFVKSNETETVTLSLKKSNNGKALAETSLSLYRDQTAPVLTIDGMSTYTVSKDPETDKDVYTYADFDDRWTNVKSIAIDFTVSDEGVGLASDFSIANCVVKANDTKTSSVEVLPESENKYRARFTLSDANEIKLKIEGLKDVLGNESTEVTEEKGIDTTPPVVEDIKVKVSNFNNDFVDPKTIPLLFSKINYTVKCKVADKGSIVSGIKDDSIVLKLGENSELTLTKTSDGYYSDPITADVIAKAKGGIFVYDNAGNESEEAAYIIKDKFDEISVNKANVKNGDEIKYTLKVAKRENDPDITVTKFIISDGIDLVGTKEVTIPGENLGEETTETVPNPVTVDNNGKAVFEFTVPENRFNDLSTITVNKISFYTGIKTDNEIDMISPPAPGVKYYAPIKLTSYRPASLSIKITKKNGGTDDTCACHGDEIKVTLNSSDIDKNNPHKVSVIDCTLSYSIDGGKNWINVSGSSDLIHQSNFEDTQAIQAKAEYRLQDISGNIATGDTPQNIKTVINSSTGITYYAPISEDNVIISCSSSNHAPNRYANNTDTLTFKAEVDTKKGMNDKHGLNFSVTVDKMNGLTADEKNSSAKIPDISADIPNITYNMTVSDDAGQSFAVTKESGIDYLSPIMIKDISFKSNERFSDFARNGSTLTFTAQVNHKVVASGVSVGSFSATTVNAATTDLRFEFNGIGGSAADNESMIRPSFTLTDAAGNTFDYSETKPEIQYDSTIPKVSIAPKLNGFLNRNFSCTVSFEDNYLYADGMKFDCVSGDRVIASISTEDFAENSTKFEQTLNLSDEGTYRISASVTDKAGNSASDRGMTITIDKTAPNITSVKITDDTILIFKKGFVISDYVDIEEAFINELICKLSDSSGIFDWDIDEPIETEGKKTVSIVVTDMAGNMGSFDFEVYIDATAPAPVINDTVTSRELVADKENKFTKELNLSVLLETPQIPNMLQDEFTTLKLLDADGNVLYDFISKDGLKTKYTYSITEYGKYVLMVEAKDHAIAKDGDDGNVYGPAKYYITFTDGNIIEVIGDNPILMYSLISLLALALIGGGIFAFFLLAKEKRQG